MEQETEENHQPATLFTEKLYYITLYRVHLTMTRFELTTLVVINTDYTSNKEISDVKRLFLLETINSLYLNETRISLPVDLWVMNGE